LRWGEIARAEPLCREFGFSRGKPIDRHYIESFLADHRADIHGDVLEVGDDSYSRMFGGEKVTGQNVIHVRPHFPGATIHGDLSRPGVLPEGVFDCIILTQTLHLIFDVESAVDQIHRSLKPGGVALITVPGISPVDRGEWGESWYWSFTEAALRAALECAFRASDVQSCFYGNLYAATMFLHSAAVEDINISRLNQRDSAYPVVVAARAAKAAR